MAETFDGFLGKGFGATIKTEGWFTETEIRRIGFGIAADGEGIFFRKRKIFGGRKIFLNGNFDIESNPGTGIDTAGGDVTPGYARGRTCLRDGLREQSVAQ